jgi:hypothetical protein
LSVAQFWTDSIALCCSNVEAAKKWWIESFECKQVKLPIDWDDPLPSDVALRLPGHDSPTILLSSWSEAKPAGYERANARQILFCRNLKKAHEYLLGRSVIAGPAQEGGGTEFFEVRDAEGNVIEICREP